MSKRSTVAGVALAVLAVTSLGLLIERGAGAPARNTLPRSDNGDPRGLLAAYRYLEARGAVVQRIENDFAAGALGARVLVLAGPETRALGIEEVDAALAVAARGGTLVVALGDLESPARTQPALAARLGLTRSRRAGEVPVHRPPGRDASEVVHAWLPDPILGEARELLARVVHGIDAPGFRAIAGSGGTPVVLARAHGAGRVYLFATPTLLENHRIDLADNAWLLEGILLLADGPIRFDEVHHTPPGPTEGGSILSHPAILAASLHLGVAGALLLLAAGRRFGPVRPLVIDRRRSSGEYAETLAALYKSAGVEPELCEEVYWTLRRRLHLHARLGLGEDLDAAALAARGPFTEAEAESLLAPFAARPRRLLDCIRAAARIEARLSPGARSMVTPTP